MSDSYPSSDPKLNALIHAAKRWANYQDEDSILDQKTDYRLAAEAQRATENLLAAIGDLP